VTLTFRFKKFENLFFIVLQLEPSESNENRVARTYFPFTLQ
jgi:hypothetical protein